MASNRPKQRDEYIPMILSLQRIIVKTSDKIWRRFDLSEIIFKSKKSELNFAYKK